MSVRRHRECFQKAIGKFNQSASMVGEYEVFFLAPCSLTWEDFFKKISPFLGINFGERFRYRGHRTSPLKPINFFRHYSAANWFLLPAAVFCAPGVRPSLSGDDGGPKS